MSAALNPQLKNILKDLVAKSDDHPAWFQNVHVIKTEQMSTSYLLTSSHRLLHLPAPHPQPQNIYLQLTILNDNITIKHLT